MVGDCAVNDGLGLMVKVGFVCSRQTPNVDFGDAGVFEPLADGPHCRRGGDYIINQRDVFSYKGLS